MDDKELRIDKSDEALKALWKMIRSNELYTYEMFKDDLTTWFRKFSTLQSTQLCPSVGNWGDKPCKLCGGKLPAKMTEKEAMDKIITILMPTGYPYPELKRYALAIWKEMG